MGSCITKCSRKRKRQDQELPNLVQDKKVIITQAPISPISLTSSKHLLSLPQSPTSTSSSVSSFSCTNGKVSTNSYSFTSSSSSSLCSLSKDRSFSNEYLKSCVKENPHIIQDHEKVSSALNLNKRARASAKSSSDFALTRQKSFRREIERKRSPHSLTRSAHRSPSPSRRLSNTPKDNAWKMNYIADKSIASITSSLLVKRESLNVRPSSPRHNLARDGAHSTTRERCSYNKIASKIDKIVKVGDELARKQDLEGPNVRPSSPMHNLARDGAHSTTRERCSYNKIASKIDKIVKVGDELARKQDLDGDNTLMEDIDNPLIALDCFIFL